MDIQGYLSCLVAALLIIGFLYEARARNGDRLPNSKWTRDRDTDTGDYVYRLRSEYNAQHAAEQARIKERLKELDYHVE